MACRQPSVVLMSRLARPDEEKAAMRGGASVTTAGPPKDTRGQLAESKHLVLPWHRPSGWALCPSRDGKKAGPWWGGASPPGGPVQSPPSRASVNRDVFAQPPPASPLHFCHQIKQLSATWISESQQIIWWLSTAFFVVSLKVKSHRGGDPPCVHGQ